MSYFFKKTKNKKGTYLQIYESYYDLERKRGAHHSYKPIGYVHELQEKGIDDPISFYKEEVKNSIKKSSEKISLKKHVRSLTNLQNDFLDIFQ